MADHAIELSQLHHHFGGRAVLHELDLTVDRGTVFALLGRNGGGKTTLIRMLLGMIRPRRGQLRVLGFDPAVEAMAIRQRVGYVPQESDFDPLLRVGEGLDFIADFYPGRWLDERCVEWLDRFELDRRQPIRELSGGQLGRLSLTAALAVDPELLILDEPTAGLDPVIRRDFAEAVIDFTADGERTVLLSSHLLNEVERLAEEVAILDRGSILLSSPIDALKRDLLRLTARFEVAPAALDTPYLAAHCTGDAWHVIDWARDEVARDDAIARLRALGATEVEVGDSSLDSIFVDLVGGHGHA